MPRILDGKKCAACTAYLFEDDDVVVCPECGAPFHRACYDAYGHCPLIETHGTENAYDVLLKKQKEADLAEGRVSLICPNCGRQINEKTPFCPYCGSEMEEKKGEPAFKTIAGMPFAFRYDPLGGVKENAKIADDVTAAEAAAYIGPKSDRYIRRFEGEKRGGWNFAAFIMPTAWFCYRKMYKWAAVSFIVFVASLIVMLPFYNSLTAALESLPVDSQANADMMALVSMIPIKAQLSAVLSSLIMGAVSVLSGIFGERLYKEKIVTSVRKIRENYEGDEINGYLRAKGGTNFYLMAIAAIIIYNASYILNILSDIL